MNRRTLLGYVALASAILIGAASTGLAQRGEGEGGGGRGGGIAVAADSARMKALTDTLKLTKEQQTVVKQLMDDGYKSAQGERDGLAKARPAILAAVKAGKGQADIDTAVKAYATQATAMGQIEIQTLAKIMKALTPEQLASQGGVRSAGLLLHGAFATKRWDEIPDPDKSY